MISLIGQSALFFQAARSKIPKADREHDLARWLKTSFPMFLTGGFQLLLAFSDIIILGFFVEPHHLALYYAATRISTQVGTVQFSIATAVAQKMSALSATKQTAELYDLITDTTRWIFWPTFLVFCVVVVLGWPLLWLFGAEFTTAYPILLILACGALVQSSVGAAEDVLKMVGFESVEFSIKAVSTALNVILNLLFIPLWGIYGAALATSISLCTYALLSEMMVRRFVGTSIFFFTLRPKHLTADIHPS